MEDFGDVEQADDVAVLIANRLCNQLDQSETREKKAYQVPEMFFYHKLQSLSCTCSIPRHHWITSHHLTDCGCVGVNTLSSDLSGHVRLLKHCVGG